MRRLMRVVLAMLLCTAALPVALILATKWLIAPDPPVSSDLMVVLAGGSGERTETALSLYRAGYAPAILLTSFHGYPAHEMAFLLKEGVPASALVAPLRPARSTREDAVAIEEIIRRREVRSLLVVTSPYHCRRARLILARALSGHGVRLAVTPSSSLYMNAGRWWGSRQGWITVPGEFPKLLLASMTAPGPHWEPSAP